MDFTADYNWHFFAYYSKSQGNEYIHLDGTSEQTVQAYVFNTDVMQVGYIGKRMTGAGLFDGEMARFGFKFNENLSLSDFSARCNLIRAEFNPTA